MRTLILAFATAALALANAATAPAGSADVERCVRTKVRAAAGQGQGVDLTGIRALCRQIHGDDVQVQGTDTIRPGNGADLTLLEDACIAYAKDAVEKAAYGTQMCGYSGPRYTTSEADHRNWCKGVPREVAESERNARTAEVSACRNCQMYKDRTVEQFNRKQQCLSSVSGPLWVENPVWVHFNWCLIREPGKDARMNLEAYGVAQQRNYDLDTCMRAPVLR
jgi:hypothetical protein